MPRPNGAMTVGLRAGSADRATLWSVLTGVAGQGALLVSGPVVARLLGVEKRGYLALFMLVSTVVAQVAHLGLPDSLPFHIAGEIRRLPRVAAAVFKPFLIQAALATCFGGLAVIAFAWRRPEDIRLAAILSFPTIFLAIAQSYGFGVLLGLHHFTRFQVLRLLPAALYAGGTVCLLFMGLRSLWAVATVYLVSQLAVTLLLAIVLPAAPLDTTESPLPIRDLLRFGVRGWLGTTSPVEALRPDQLIVGFFLSPTALGLYVIGIAFTNLPRFIAQSIGLVAYPRIAAEVDPRTALRAIKRYALVTLGISTAVVATLALGCSTLITTFFGEAFSGAAPVTRILLLAAIPNSIRRVLGDGLRGMGHPDIATLAEIVTALTLLVFLAILLPREGLEGAAAALTIAATFGVAVVIMGFRHAEHAVRPAGRSDQESA